MGLRATMIAVALTAAVPCSAAEVLVSFNGTLTTVNGTGFVVGDQFAGSFVYDTDAIPTFQSSGLAFFQGPATFNFFINGIERSVLPGRYIIGNDGPTSVFQYQSGDANTTFAISGLPTFADFSTLPSAASITGGTGRFNVLAPGFTGNGNGTASYSAVALAAAIPEPATWAMTLLGFGLIGGAMRYRRRPKITVRYA